MIATAMLTRPRLLIADEPTTALDVTVQAQILRLFKELQKEFGIALILITHDLGVVAQMGHRVAVMYAGRIVETGAVADVLAAPRHPYTRGLLDCVPTRGAGRAARLGSIPGIVPSLIGEAIGCSFRNRCGHAAADCAAGAIEMRQLVSGRGYRCIHPVASS
jgi:peptide/nickel transport system ATP-binding protein